MSERGARRLAKAIFALILLELIVSVTFGVLDIGEGGSASLGDLGFLGPVMLFPIIGLLLASRRPENALGWVMLGIGVAGLLPGDAYGSYALHTGLPGGDWAFAAVSWTWVPVIGLAGTFVLLLFPDGHLPSPRWRWFAWTIAIGMT